MNPPLSDACYHLSPEGLGFPARILKKEACKTGRWGKFESETGSTDEFTYDS